MTKAQIDLINRCIDEEYVEVSYANGINPTIAEQPNNYIRPKMWCVRLRLKGEA